MEQKQHNIKAEILVTRKPHVVMETKGNNNKILEAKNQKSEHNNKNEGRQLIRNRRTKHRKTASSNHRKKSRGKMVHLEFY